MKKVENEAIDFFLENWIQEHGYDSTGLGYLASAASDRMAPSATKLSRKKYLDKLHKKLQDEATKLVNHLHHSIDGYIHDREMEEDEDSS